MHDIIKPEHFKDSPEVVDFCNADNIKQVFADFTRNTGVLLIAKK